jgi:hypothetical protein
MSTKNGQCLFPYAEPRDPNEPNRRTLGNAAVCAAGHALLCHPGRRGDGTRPAGNEPPAIRQYRMPKDSRSESSIEGQSPLKMEL